MELERIDFPDALKLLAKDARIDFSKYDFKEKSASSSSDKQHYLDLMDATMNYFEEHLRAAFDVMSYCTEKRKLSKEDIAYFHIGYAPAQQYDLLKTLHQHRYSSEECQKTGIAKLNQGGELVSFFKDRLMFPIIDHMDHCVGFG